MIRWGVSWINADGNLLEVNILKVKVDANSTFTVFDLYINNVF